MARTRLRGLEIAGIQIGIEVPGNFEWAWPAGPVADFQCLPRDPDVHVGIRVDAPPQEDLGGERYAFGAWTFEIARCGSDWLLALSRNGRRAQLAHFDRHFRVGEVVLAPELAESGVYPLRGPLDEWIVLHRTIAAGGLVLAGRVRVEAGRTIVRLGQDPTRPAGRRHAGPRSLIGRGTVLLRAQRDELRIFDTPWSEPLDPARARSARVDEIERVDEAELPFDDLLDPQEAAELLVRHAVVPLCDDGLFERVLNNARRLSAVVRVVDRGVSPERAAAPSLWRSPGLQTAFASPSAQARSGGRSIWHSMEQK